MIKEKNNETLEGRDQFITYDIGLASSLFTLGYNLCDVDKTNPQKSKFIFKRDKQIDIMIQKYWDNKLTLPARSLLDNQKMLKNRLYSVIVK
jgi:hypothetical protein